MRILILSDTHLSGSKMILPRQIDYEINQSDCCFHCGDFITYSLYEKLAEKIKIYAVAGNMDDEKIKTKLPKKQIIKLEGITFGLIHGRGTPGPLEQYINYQFQDNYNEINIFVYGHSHQPTNSEKGQKIYFNPGSAGGTILAYQKTYGILEIEDKKLKRSIKKIG